MILVMDIGNSNIKMGVFEGDALLHSWRISTKREKTSDEYGITIMSYFRYLGLEAGDIQGIVISSVIPPINFTMEHMCGMYFDRKPLFVGPGIKTGMNIRYEDPRELGSDRIVNAIAAFTRHGGPVITVDFGTATSFGAVDKNGNFLGGAICPGLKVAADALVLNAARLYHVELTKPASVIGRSTAQGMQAGLIYGYVGQVDYIVEKMRGELGGGNIPVIATGGMAKLIAKESRMITEVDSLLTLTGLNIVYKRNERS